MMNLVTSIAKMRFKFWWCRFRWKLHHILLQYHMKAAKYHLSCEMDIVKEVQDMSNNLDSIIKDTVEGYEKVKGKDA